MLEELVGAGEIKARTKWKDVYPLFRSDERYLNMLGNPGSNPLELFWDVLDELDQKLEKKIAVVEDAIGRYNAARAKQAGGDTNGDVKMTDGEPAAAEASQEKEKEKDAGFVVDPETAEEEFLAVVKAGSEGDIAVESLSTEDLTLVWTTVRIDSVTVDPQTDSFLLSCATWHSRSVPTKSDARSAACATCRMT